MLPDESMTRSPFGKEPSVQVVWQKLCLTLSHRNVATPPSVQLLTAVSSNRMPSPWVSTPLPPCCVVPKMLPVASSITPVGAAPSAHLDAPFQQKLYSTVSVHVAVQRFALPAASSHA